MYFPSFRKINDYISKHKLSLIKLPGWNFLLHQDLETRRNVNKKHQILLFLYFFGSTHSQVHGNKYIYIYIYIYIYNPMIDFRHAF